MDHFAFFCIFFNILDFLGTTWVSYMLDLLYFGKKGPERQTSLSIYERVPFLELNVPFMASGWRPQTFNFKLKSNHFVRYPIFKKTLAFGCIFLHLHSLTWSCRS